MTRGVEITAGQKIDVVLLYMYRGAAQHRIADIVGISISSVERLCAEIRRGGTEYLKSVGYLDSEGRPSRLARERTAVMDKRGAEEKARIAAEEARYQAVRERDKPEAKAKKSSVLETKEPSIERVVVTPAAVEKQAEEKAKKPTLVKIFGGEKVDIESVEDTSAIRASTKEVGPSHNGVVRYLVTYAQDDTPVHQAFWTNLKAFASHIHAAIRVCGVTYQKALYSDHSTMTAVYAPEVRPFMDFERSHLDARSDVLLVGSANVIPTTANALSGFQTANHGRHVIVPSARIAMEPIPCMLDDEPAFALTTGAVTVPNYVGRAAGQKALHRHTFGALLVEIDVDGYVFLRQIEAAEDGSFQDLERVATGGTVSTGNSVESIAWGDIHYDMLDPIMSLFAWGHDVALGRTVRRHGTIIDTYKPRYQYFSDTSDFRPRNHHSLYDPHARARNYANGFDDVGEWLAKASTFIADTRRDFCQSVIVESNHDAALTRWLRDSSTAVTLDPKNLLLWHRLNADLIESIQTGREINIVEHAMRQMGNLGDDVHFVGSGQSYRVNGIEYGLHGHDGVNGSRGGSVSYDRSGVKITSMHTHSPRIFGNSYVGGHNNKRRMGYNEKGMTTWAFADVVAYASGARTMLLKAPDGRWRAMGRR